MKVPVVRLRVGARPRMGGLLLCLVEDGGQLGNEWAPLGKVDALLSQWFCLTLN